MSLRFPKFQYFRSKAHLRNVANLPCQHCGIDGQTQAAHSNWSQHGKGRSIKASDEFVAALCQSCHRELDQGMCLTKEERQEMWETAYQKTKESLTDQGLWPKIE